MEKSGRQTGECLVALATVLVAISSPGRVTPSASFTSVFTIYSPKCLCCQLSGLRAVSFSSDLVRAMRETRDVATSPAFAFRHARGRFLVSHDGRRKERLLAVYQLSS